MNIEGLGSQLGSSGIGGVGKNSLGKDDFMKLLIEQLKNQDPMSPMEGAEFASQLAQFSQLEQLNNMNEQLTNSINANYQLTQSINNTMSAGLIGKEVKLEASQVNYKGQESVNIGYTLAGEASSGSLKIYNQDGVLVKEIKNINYSEGDHQVSWDFTDNNGEKLSYGNYTFEITAMNAAEETISTKAYLTGVIDSIRFNDDGTYLVVGGEQFTFSSVLEIINPTNGDGESDGGND